MGLWDLRSETNGEIIRIRTSLVDQYTAISAQTPSPLKGERVKVRDEAANESPSKTHRLAAERS
jgi:hypothetical protein